MQKLTKFLQFLKEHHLEEAARENLRMAWKLEIPIMKMMEGIPEDIVLEQTKKGLVEFADQMADGTYVQVQAEKLKHWEQGKLDAELKGAEIVTDDLILIYQLQRDLFYRFLPKYTTDIEVATEILMDLDVLQIQSQRDAMKVLVKRQRRTEEQLQLRSYLLDNATDPILTTDNERRIQYCNKACETLFGFSKEEILGKLTSDVFKIDPAYQKSRDEYAADLDTTGRSSAEMVYLSKSGEPVPVLFSASHMKDAQGEQSGIFVIFKDIRERIRHEREIEQANNFLNAVLENIPNMIFVKDAKDLRFIRFNKAGEDLLGYPKEDLIGKNDFDFFPKEQAEFFTDKDQAVLKNGKLVDIPEEPVKTRMKGMRWLHTKKIPVKGDNGSPAFLLGISEDITEQKKQADAILQLNRELEAFSYSVSHDLRAPLRAVNGYATMLEEDYGTTMDDEGRRLLGVIRYNAEKMGRLIDDLLAFSRLGRKELDTAEEDMNQLVEGVLIELNKTMRHKADIRISDLHKVKVDYGLMHQVMLNLIANAVKYSSKKEHSVVEVNSQEKDGEIIYCVKDNGVGFDMLYIDKLFGVFQRLHAMDEFEGTGVGLAIVQRIVSRHGGRVWAEAEVDKGATFCVALPAS